MSATVLDLKAHVNRNFLLTKAGPVNTIQLVLPIETRNEHPPRCRYPRFRCRSRRTGETHPRRVVETRRPAALGTRPGARTRRLAPVAARGDPQTGVKRPA